MTFWEKAEVQGQKIGQWLLAGGGGTRGTEG